jgi:hypothetical protein
MHLVVDCPLPSCSYEGTYEVNVLVSGRDITGTAAFRPAPSRKKKELTSEGRV